MHLLQTKPGGFVDDDGIADLAQSPADMVILSTADTEISLLATSFSRFPDDFPSLRLANVLHLRQHAAVDLYLETVARHARVIIVSLLGGKNYWSYGVEQLSVLSRQHNIPLALLSGDDTPDAELAKLSNVEADVYHRLWRYLREGGVANALAFFNYVGATFFARDTENAVVAPTALPKVGLYHPEYDTVDLAVWQQHWHADAPVACVLFYRAHLQAGNLRVFDALIQSLQCQKINPLPIALTSLKDPLCLEVVEALCERANSGIILNTTGFSLSSIETPELRPFRMDIPVLQVILSGGNEDDWRQGYQGLMPRDLAMNVALPEVDGRIITRAISFKNLLSRCDRTQVDLVGYQPVQERVDFVAQLAKRWLALQTIPNNEKRIAVILANYPTREGRIGNGVGLDTPASVMTMLEALQGEGYRIEDSPADGDALINALLSGVSNDPETSPHRPAFQSLSLDDYRHYFAALPTENKQQLVQRWGEPENDPGLRYGCFPIAGLRLGQLFVGIQPARGYHLDLQATYHDPDLVPPHGYLAFYFWLRHVYKLDAVVHAGKHGNLEWLPGKSVALSEQCWPDAILGPMPHIYPFIVNDPGEGSQAKRRAQAVIIDHLTPPLTRAETYGPLQDLELLVDEYYEALSVDPRRVRILREKILQLAQESHLEEEVSFATNNKKDDEEHVLQQLDAYLCELKEAQIRDGLHIFGQSPVGEQRLDTLLALARLPQGNGEGAKQSLIRALCREFSFDTAFDPLTCAMEEPWNGPRPALLANVCDAPWRSQGDTRERLELMARGLLADKALHSGLSLSLREVLTRIETDVAPRLDCSGDQERDSFLAALSGRFVPPGPSGAPSRGRVDVLPTGRNFFSVDVRAIPTVTAWHLGFKSAALLIERYLQEHGDYPQSLGLSVWGTATMRTGGDDIAQAFALLGVQPVWAPGSNRVVDFEILPVSILDRPRVDVMLRVSGFFRDAFSNVIQLFDAATSAVAALDEPDELNPLRPRVAKEMQRLMQQGYEQEHARQRASWRVFGSKPGAYGAGLQGLMDERCWQTREDLMNAYVNWGGYAYGKHADGVAATELFRERLTTIDAVVQNQDNREHDILDSDDYYQFQGGMTAAVTALRGEAPAVYLGDHSLPEAPKIRTLQEEINRVIRSRVINPKWLAGIQRHGYKGAFEMAATVDYLFAYDATTDVVQDYQYEMVMDAYLRDDTSRQFLQHHNPNALKEMSERLLEAIQRGLWRNPGDYQQHLETIILETEAGLEQS